MSAITNTTFMEAMFAEALPGTYTIVCSFPGDPYKVDRPAWFGRPWSPGQKLSAWFSTGNTYVTVSEFEPDPETGECRRRKAQFASLHAVMIDDIGTGIGSKVLRSKLVLPPSAMIETSPENYQAYLFIVQDSQARDRHICERLIQRMIEAGLTADGKDPGMAGVTRYGRLPIGINSKAKYVEKLGRPFQTRCTEFEPTQRYTIAEIAAAWKLDLSAPESIRAKVISITPHLLKQSEGKFSALIEVLQQMQMYLGQRGTWHDIVCPWVADHTDRSTSGTAISEPAADNNYAGGFKCHHGHCEQRTMSDVRRWLRELVRLLDEQRSAQ